MTVAQYMALPHILQYHTLDPNNHNIVRVHPLRYKTLHHVTGSQNVNKEKHSRNQNLPTYRFIQLPDDQLLFYDMRHGNYNHILWYRIYSTCYPKFQRLTFAVNRLCFPTKVETLTWYSPFKLSFWNMPIQNKDLSPFTGGNFEATMQIGREMRIIHSILLSIVNSA